MFGGQRAEQFVHVAVHDRSDLVQRQVDAVVGDPPLREVVGTDALGAVAGTDQRLARTCTSLIRAASTFIAEALLACCERPS